jgi:hypothetical protein
LHTFDLVAKSMSAQRPKGDAEIIGYEKIISLLTCWAIQESKSIETRRVLLKSVLDKKFNLT